MQDAVQQKDDYDCFPCTACSMLLRLSSAVRSQEEPGGARRSQEEPGGARRSQGEPGGARRSQEEPGGARALGIYFFLKKSTCGSLLEVVEPQATPM